jgi:CubicO group peptidase (beta-lactamase class C family)
MRTWTIALTVALLGGVCLADAAEPRTRVAIVDNQWHINGRVTYPGAAAEGLLMNVRTVNATFEDANDTTRPKAFDPDANTAAFLKQIPDYVAHGVRAFTLCLQGGMPGYEGAVNSAFNADGSLRPNYLNRIARVIEACDEQGVVVILGCYYQRQDQILADEQAVRAGVVNTVKWIVDKGYGNVVLEIANEFAHGGFNHPILKTAKGEAELIALAKQTAPQLLISTSGMGSGSLPDDVARAADFLLIHFNSTKLDDIPARIAALKKHHKPIVCNEDDKFGDAAAKAAELSVANGASWGFMHNELNQYVPFEFHGAADDPAVYRALRELTTPAKAKQSYFPPPDAQGGWRTLSDAGDIRRETGIDQAQLDRTFEYIQGSTKNGGLAVVRHGYLVYERYFGMGHRDATPNLASCGKSFTSIAVGILMRERPDLFPEGLEQKVFTPALLPAEAFPLSDPRKAQIKLGQLLAFSAGIRGNNPSYVQGKRQNIDPLGPDGWPATVDAVALGREDTRSDGHFSSAATLWCDPGEGYSYATSSIHITSIVLRHVSGRELEDYIAEHLAQPLGWGRWGWGYKHAKDVKHTPGGGGIALRATDMLRFGYLLLNEGEWNGMSLVPADYVRAATRQSIYNPHYGYSLQFNVNTNGEIATLPRDAFWKTGSGGHALYVVPSLDLVVWKLGGRDGQYSQRDTGLEPPPEAIANASSRAGWKEQVDAQTASIKTLEMVIQAIPER